MGCINRDEGGGLSSYSGAKELQSCQQNSQCEESWPNGPKCWIYFLMIRNVKIENNQRFCETWSVFSLSFIMIRSSLFLGPDSGLLGTLFFPQHQVCVELKLEAMTWLLLFFFGSCSSTNHRQDWASPDLFGRKLDDGLNFSIFTAIHIYIIYYMSARYLSTNFL